MLPHFFKVHCAEVAGQAFHLLVDEDKALVDIVEVTFRVLAGVGIVTRLETTITMTALIHLCQGHLDVHLEPFYSGSEVAHRALVCQLACSFLQ